MRSRVLVVFSVLLFSFPVLAERPVEAEAQTVGVLHFDGQQIEIHSWSWGATQTVIRSGSGGVGAGKVQFQDFHFTKQVDKSSAKLFRACATGQHFPSATLVVRKKGGGQQEYLIVKFSDVLVTSYSSGGSGSDALPVETISFNVGEVDLQVPAR